MPEKKEHNSLHDCRTVYPVCLCPCSYYKFKKVEKQNEPKGFKEDALAELDNRLLKVEIAIEKLRRTKVTLKKYLEENLENLM